VHDRRLAPAQVTNTHFAILNVLEQRPGMAIAELAEVMDRTTTLRAVKPLEREGLVVRQPADARSRQLGYSATPLGQAKILLGPPLREAAQHEYETVIGMQQAWNLLRDVLAVARLMAYSDQTREPSQPLVCA
jgi:DNA-binding MarR family transcriptional regulator